MTTPFDAIAAQYGELWSDQPKGRAQRAEVWKDLDELFFPSEHVLDLGCGIGDDAEHLGARGVTVTAIDASQEMAAAARARGVNAACLPIEALGELTGVYDGAYSNFAAFNCVKDVRPASAALGRLIRPGGAFVLCVLSRFCLGESAEAFRRGDWTGATRRWSGHTIWRGMDVYYRSRAAWTLILGPEFRLVRDHSIGGGDHWLYVFVRRSR